MMRLRASTHSAGLRPDGHASRWVSIRSVRWVQGDNDATAHLGDGSNRARFELQRFQPRSATGEPEVEPAPGRSVPIGAPRTRQLCDELHHPENQLVGGVRDGRTSQRSAPSQFKRRAKYAADARIEEDMHPRRKSVDEGGQVSARCEVEIDVQELRWPNRGRRALRHL